MNKVLGTPWNFENEYPSPNGEISLAFGYVGEVAMGAPLAGECFLKINGEKLKLNGRFGGPIVWDENSEKAVIPYWTPNRFQKIAIIDTSRMKMMVSKKEFRVIELSKFKNGLIYGVDSPIYRTERIEFDIEMEKYDSEIEIKTECKTKTEIYNNGCKRTNTTRTRM